MDYKEPEKEFSIGGIVDRFEGDMAVVILKKYQQSVYWPKDKLTSDVNIGDSVWLHLACDKDLTQERTRLARKILEEIINGNEEQ